MPDELPLPGALGSPASDGGLVAGHERLSPDALAREAIWLGLRMLDDGIDRAAYQARFGVDPVARFNGEMSPLAAGGLLEIDDRAVRLTRRGALLADEVALRFL